MPNNNEKETCLNQETISLAYEIDKSGVITRVICPRCGKDVQKIDGDEWYCQNCMVHMMI